METKFSNILPHPDFLDWLFIHKSKASSVFREVIGLHEVAHISITHINANQQLLSLSSSPALEYNLFNSGLWQFDHSYHPGWFNQCRQASWQSLYNPDRYDELYYLKQIKHAYPIGQSMAARIDGELLIFSLASKKSCQHTQDLFNSQRDELYKIGQYCTNELAELFQEKNDDSKTKTLQVEL